MQKTKLSFSYDKVLIFIGYLLVGAGLLFVDNKAAFMYFTVLPINYAFLNRAIKRKNLSLTLFCVFLFISQGVNSVTFFIYKEDYSAIGFKAIGSFDFSILEYLYCYSYVLVFSLACYFVTLLFTRRYSDSSMDFLLQTFSKKKAMKSLKSSTICTLLTVVVCTCSIILTIAMYYGQLGIRGMNQTELPFHLTGILYYFREIIITGILFILYLKSKNQSIAVVSICIYLFFAGFTSVSRGLVGFLLIPIIAECIISKKKRRALVLFLYYCILFWGLTKARNYVYLYGTIHYSLSELISLSYKEAFISPLKLLMYLVNEISGRLYGGQSVVLSSQYNCTSYIDLIHYYFGENISSIVPNMMLNMFGIVAPSGMSYGVSVGYIGQMIILSNGNYIYVVLQGVIIGSLLSIEENLTNSIHQRNPLIIKELLAIGIVGLSIVVLWLGLSMMLIYVFIFALIILSTKIKSRCYIYKTDQDSV